MFPQPRFRARDLHGLLIQHNRSSRTIVDCRNTISHNVRLRPARNWSFLMVITDPQLNKYDFMNFQFDNLVKAQVNGRLRMHAVICQMSRATGPRSYFRFFSRTSQSCLHVQTIRHLLPLITDCKYLFCSRIWQYFPKYKWKYNAWVIAISRSEADGK